VSRIHVELLCSLQSNGYTMSVGNADASGNWLNGAVGSLATSSPQDASAA
jgi:hypothetical protein